MPKGPLVCDFAEARRGCRTIADHVIGLADASRVVLESARRGQAARSVLRSANIINLIAYEEAGKLFMMWQALADAERKNQDKIRIEEFEYHGPKGDLAGDLFCQMLDFAEKTAMGIADIVKDPESGVTPEEETMLTQIMSILRSSFSVQRERVNRIRRQFKQEREDAMYTDFRNGDWVPSPELSPGTLAMDYILLRLVAKGANAYLMEELPFSLATKALLDMSKNVKSEEADKFLSVLKKNDPKWFSIPE